MFNEMKQDQDPMKRLSSMMQIVLENTDNAIHKPTPPPSPKRPLKHTKLLNPFAAFTGTGRKKTTAITMAAATTSNTTSGPVPVPVATTEPGRYFPSPPGSPPDYKGTGTRKRNSIGSVCSNTTSPPGSPPEYNNNTRKRNSVGSVCSINSVSSSTSGMNNSTNTRGSSKPNNIHSNKVYITNETDHPTTTTTTTSGTTSSTGTTTAKINPFPQLPTGRTKEAPRKKSTHLVLIHPEKDILTG